MYKIIFQLSNNKLYNQTHVQHKDFYDANVNCRIDPRSKTDLRTEIGCQKWKLLGSDFISEFLAGDRLSAFPSTSPASFLRRQIKWPMQKSHKISYNLAQSASRCSMSCVITVLSLEWTSAPPASMRELGRFLHPFLSPSFPSLAQLCPFGASRLECRMLP